jgi:hypothetical protein
MKIEYNHARLCIMPVCSLVTDKLKGYVPVRHDLQIEFLSQLS